MTTQDYQFTFTELRASEKDGKRYARVRAIANGPDSYSSIFTENARSSIIRQIQEKGVRSSALHADAVLGGLNTYLQTRASQASTVEERQLASNLQKSLPMTQYPIGKAVDAKFIDDSTVEVLIEENTVLKELGPTYANYLDTHWKMIQDGVLSGVSIVFNSVKKFMANDKLFIDDLNLAGIDFVDRPAHPDTKVLEVFVRAMQDTGAQEQQKGEHKKMAEDKFVDVEKVVEQKLQQKEEAKKAQAELDAKFKEYESKITELTNQTNSLQKEKEEAIALAKEAIDKIKVLTMKPVVPQVDPHLERAQRTNAPSKLDDVKSLKDLFRLKDQLK